MMFKVRKNSLNTQYVKCRQHGADSGNQVDGVCNCLVLPYPEIMKHDPKAMCSMPQSEEDYDEQTGFAN